MKKPVVDYRQFRLHRRNEPQFAHLKLLGWWVVYFGLFILTERQIPAERCSVVHCFLDDRIPFCEVFLIPYVLWYVWVAGSLLYFALYRIDSFLRLQRFLIVTQLAAMAIYILFPSRQELRPEIFPRDNWLTRGVELLYAIDTNTNVCPSMHVAFSLGVASVWLKEREATTLFKGLTVVFAMLVCLSTVFLKQHSVVDFWAALPVCLLAEGVACGAWWKNRRPTY